MADGTIDRLEIQVQTQAQKANTDLDKLVGKLERMSGSLNRLDAGGLKNLANGVDTLGRSVQNMSTVKTSDFTRLAKNIEKLGNINQVGINNTANALRQISSALTATSGMSGNVQQLSDLANGISRLGYKSVTNAITNLPLLAQGMRNFMQTLSTAPQVSANLIQMTNAMANLAAQGSKYSSTIKSISSATNTLTRTHNAAYKSNVNFFASLSKIAIGYYMIRRAIRATFEPISKSMNLGETINLFQTSFKKIGMEAAEESGFEWGSEAADAYAISFLDKAQKFNDKITDALSLDPNTTMKYQAVFGQMANAFGLATKSVTNLSQSFTMLGLDISSFFNTGVEEAMVKLRAGLAGETEPLRALGVDITETTLKMTALKYGIEDSIDKMSQAAKTQLRWLAIMEQTETVFGDMAKTIDSPANQTRILQQQMENLSRSIGSIFLPIIQTVLPYVNAFFIALRRIADTIAGAMGYELPDYKGSDIYQDVTGDIEGIGDSSDNTTKSVNKLKKALASFDELNILGSGKAKGINLGSGYSELDDAISAKTDSYMAKFNAELANMGNKAEELADKIQPKLQAVIDTIDKFSPAFKGLAAGFVAYKVVGLFKGLATALTALGPTGIAVVAIVGGLVAVYEAIKKHNENLKKEDLASRFGEIKISLEEIDEIATTLTTSTYSAKIDVYITEKQKLSELQTSIETSLSTLQKLNWKLSVGIELTPEEVATYGETIKKFIADSEAYIEQQQYVTHLAVEAVIQDANFKQEISGLVDKYFDGSKGEMARLGKQLRSEMDNALADGIIDANEQKVIDNLVKEITEIQERVADAEFVAKLQTLTLEGDLDAESYKKLIQEIQEKIDERSKGADGAAQQLLTVVNAQYQLDMKNATTEAQRAEIKKKYDADVQKISDNLAQTKISISEVGMKFAYDQIKEHWKPEMDKFSTNTTETVKTVFQGVMDDGMMGVDPSGTLNTFFTRTLDAFNKSAKDSGMDKAARSNLEDFLKELEPTSEDNKKLADQYIATGQALPQALSDQLTDEAMLKALAGDVDGIWFVVGQQMADSPEIIKMIKNGELNAQNLDDSIIKGLKSKIPDLKLAGDKLITETDGAIRKAAKNSADNNITGYVGGMIVVAKNAFEKDTTTKKAVESWLNGISNTIKTFKLPTMEVNIGMNTSALEAFYRGTQAAGITIEGRASGGYVNDGQIFAARENGIPEMIGRIGNRTAVANNDQITEGIASAVKGALIEVMVPIMSAMGNSGGGQIIENILNIDGDTIYHAYNRAKRANDARFNPIRV